MNVSKVQAARKQLNTYTFDASNYLENHITTVSIDGPEPEKKLFDLFDKLTKQFTDLSLLVEEDVSQLQTTASHTERILLHEMEYNSEKLVEVGDAVDSVKLSFDMASEGAVRIGGKLSSAERERTHIDKSIELLGYIKLFQETPSEMFNQAVKPSSSTKDLREALPPGLQKKNWGTISEMLHDLKKILFELNTDDIKVAQTNIGRVADRVEMELLNDFEKLLIEIISNKQEDPRKLEQARELAEWLHLFSQGQSIQKRYIFTVVQHRIPNDTFFQSNSLVADSPRNATLSARLNPAKAAAAAAAATTNVSSWFFTSKNNNNKMAQSRHNPNAADDEFSDTESDGMASGPSTHYPMGRSMHDGHALSLMDHLSGLFSMINTVCQEQFSIIRAVFPTHTIAKVTRMLIQRIFNDPAFGIQARVDAILCPAPPQPQLALPDYLDALVIVREKLSALYLLLLECCSHPSMRGMGSESACLKKAKSPNPYGRTKKNNNNNTHSNNEHGINGHSNPQNYPPHSANNSNSNSHNGHSNGSNGHSAAVLSNMYLDADEEAEEILHSDAEIRDFFDDQIGQVFSTYLSDYFSKESQHVRNQYAELLRNNLDDANLLNKAATNGVLAQVPVLRWDRVKTAQQLVNTIGNKVFLNRVFSVTTDTVCRMESIGRDDKKLTHRLKDLFLLQMAFLSEGLFGPWSKACVAALLRQYTNRASTTTLPPPEILALLGVLTYGVGRIKSHFDEVFLRPLSIVPNIVAVCKESRMKVFRELDVTARQIIYAWTLCSVALVEKTLTSLQSKYDYAPKFESHSNTRVEATTACDSAVKIIFSIVSAIKNYEPKLLGLDLVKLFWRPLGQQVVGLIVSHVRKQRVTPEGCKYLSRDIKEYSKVLTFVEAPDVIDMMACLRELLVVFTTPAPNVAKLVVEELRYLDSAVLIAFLRARSDFNGREPDHYTAQLSPYYPNVKLDIALPWENRKPITNSVLAEAAAQGTKWTSTLGPNSLRRTAGSAMNPVSALFMTEVARTTTLTPAQLTANGRTVTVDLNRIDEEDDVESIPVRALSVQGDPHANRRTGNFSTISQFLPNRPDDAVSSPAFGSAPAPTAVAAKTGSSIARPDHIINGTATTTGAAGAAGVGAGVKGRPQSSAVKSSAATLLSAGLNGGPAAAPTDKRASLPLGRPPSLVPEKPLGNVSAADAAGQGQAASNKKLLNKMASFFQR